MTKSQIIDYIDFNYPDYSKDILIIDGFEEAFLGIVEGFNNKPVSCYDHSKCIDVLVSSNEDTTDLQDKIEEAEEYFNYNIIGAYVGEFTPVFLYPKQIM